MAVIYKLATITRSVIIFENIGRKYSKRITDGIKSVSLMPWLLTLVLILLGIFYIKDSFSKIMLLLCTLGYLGLLIYWINKFSKTNILKIVIEDNQLVINAEIKSKNRIFKIPLTELTFRTIDKSKYSLREIQFLRNKELKLRQYVNVSWSNDDFDRLEKKLKENGIKKPYGENL